MDKFKCSYPDCDKEIVRSAGFDGEWYCEEHANLMDAEDEYLDPDDINNDQWLWI